MPENLVSSDIDFDLNDFTDLSWCPDDYGFKQIIKGDVNKNPVWKKWHNGKVFVLIRIKKTLFVLKKEIRSKDGVRRLVKFHTVIDSKGLADVYLIKGLRG